MQIKKICLKVECPWILKGQWAISLIYLTLAVYTILVALGVQFKRLLR